MQDERGGPAYGRTNWRRFGLAVALPIVATGVAVAGVANGALAAQFAVSGQTFKISADRLEGEGFVQYGSAVVDKEGKRHFVATSGIGKAELTKLCQSVKVPGVPVSLVINAGDGKEPAKAENMLIDMTDLSGEAVFTDINIGQDASTLTAGGERAHGTEGAFGQQARHITVTGLRQTAWATTASSFTLSNLSLKVDVGSADKPAKECF